MAETDGAKSARRAKMILLVVVLFCMAVSLALIVAVMEGPRAKKQEGATAGQSPGKQDSTAEEASVFAAYGTSATCQSCHETEFRDWAGSHHALAERPARQNLDRAAFDPARNIVEMGHT